MTFSTKDKMRVEWNTEEESTNVITLRGLGLPML